MLRRITLTICLSFMLLSVAIGSDSKIGSWKDGSPQPGTPCHSAKNDCDAEMTQMVCVGHKGSEQCNCRPFYVVTGFNVTKPIFDKSVNACVVRRGEHCETDDPDTYITCEPNTVCDEDLVPEHKDVGICVTDSGVAPSAITTVSGFMTVLIPLSIVLTRL